MSKSIREQLKEAKAEVARLRKMSRCKRQPDLKTLGGIIQHARESSGMGLNEAASKADMSPSIWSRIESDAIKANPQLRSLMRLSACLNTPLSVIFKQWEDAR